MEGHERGFIDRVSDVTTEPINKHLIGCAVVPSVGTHYESAIIRGLWCMLSNTGK